MQRSILGEINGQGGIIAVPSHRTPNNSISMSHAKTLMEINAMNAEPIYASGADPLVVDRTLEKAKMDYTLAQGGVSSVDAAKVAKFEAGKGSVEEVKTMMAISARGKPKEDPSRCMML
jgi:hypothetical protein